MRRSYWVYILSSISGVLYVGVTNDLPRRLWEHRSGKGGEFTAKYRVNRLMYAEEHHDVATAIEREKQVKRWRRQKKIDLIRIDNPDMLPLDVTG